MNGGEMVRTRARGLVALVGLAALMSGALAACGPFGFSTVPQQSCKARSTGALGPAGGVVVPLAARDPTDTAHNVSALYALDGTDGKLTWSCVSTTYAGWNDVQQVGGVIYALAGTEPNRGGAATHAHAIYAIRPREGKQLWEYSFLAGSTSPMTFGDGMLFTSTVTGGLPAGPPGHQNPATPPSQQTALLALRTSSGALAWSENLDGAFGEPFVVGRQVFVLLSSQSEEWVLRTYDAENGRVTWSLKLGTPDELVEVTHSDSALYAMVDQVLKSLDGANGATRWMRTLPVPMTGLIQLDASAVLIPTDRALYAYDLASGAPRWSAAIDRNTTTWLAPDQRIYALSENANNTPDRLIALDGTTGKTLWSRDVSGLQSLGLSLGASGTLYLTEPTRAQLDETVVAMDARGGEQWRHDGPSPYNNGEILLSSGNLYYIWQAPNGVAGTNTADVTYVTCLSVTDGAVRWQTALPGVNGDPVGPLVAS
jgi:outer membrane protein assembly factor BamB